MKNKIETTTALGKNAIVQMAKKILEKKYPTLKININDFELTAWFNSEGVFVKFRRLIAFIPLGREKGDFEYDLSVNVISKKVDPLDDWGTELFYMPSKEEIEKIEFVKKAFNLPFLGFDIDVSEEADMYAINTTNDVAFGMYQIDKITGLETSKSSIEGSWDSQIETTEEDGLTEIKE